MTNQDLVRSRMADACNRELAKQRIVSAYGTDDGVPPDTIFDQPKAEEALEHGKFVVSTVEALIASREP